MDSDKWMQEPIPKAKEPASKVDELGQEIIEFIENAMCQAAYARQYFDKSMSVADGMTDIINEGQRIINELRGESWVGKQLKTTTTLNTLSR